MNKVIDLQKAVVGFAGISLLAIPVAFASAHGAGSSVWTVDAIDKNCMGQLARMYAQDETKETNGLPASFAKSTHSGFGLGKDKGDSVHDTMHAFQDYCKAE